ncbi:MAG: DNA alkylation repair protein [Proteobacteria bacterium]|nr:DNA alkylation repair protein [Pseudomonadota bacterium]
MIDDLIAWVRAELTARADPEAAPAMAAYLKTDMPFYGVKRPALKAVTRGAKAFKPSSREVYEQAVRALWAQPHREEKYIAIQYARAFRRYVTIDSLPLYLFMVRDGAWWDLVDEIASHLVGKVWMDERDVVGTLADQWVLDESLWIRRTALIGQLRHKADTDSARLFRYSADLAHEREFFIRKAIGWSLRQYGRTDPDAVRDFVEAQGDRLSGLSRREALKHLS